MKEPIKLLKLTLIYLLSYLARRWGRVKAVSIDGGKSGRQIENLFLTERGISGLISAAVVNFFG